MVAQEAGHGKDVKDEDHFPERRTRQAETRSRRQREKSPPVRGGTITGGELKNPIWKSEYFVGKSRIHQIQFNFPIWKYESFVGNLAQSKVSLDSVTFGRLVRLPPSDFTRNENVQRSALLAIKLCVV